MKHFLALFTDSFLGDLRSKRLIVFLILYLGVFGLLMYLFLQIQTTVSQEIVEQGISPMEQDFIRFFLIGIIRGGAGDAGMTVVRFVENTPFLNVALLVVATYGTPILLGILNYDKISQEIYDGSIRFKLYRTKRSTFYLAKFFSSFAISLVATGIALLATLAWAQLSIPQFNGGEALTVGLRLWVMSNLFLMVFLALFIAFSSWFTKSFTALSVCIVAYITLLLLPFWVPWISPYDSRYMLPMFSPHLENLWLPIGSFTFMTVTLLYLGYLRFAHRDLI